MCPSIIDLPIDLSVDVSSDVSVEGRAAATGSDWQSAQELPGHRNVGAAIVCARIQDEEDVPASVALQMGCGDAAARGCRQ